MDINDFKEMMGKTLKGCGCLSIGFVVLLVVVGIFVDDEEQKDAANESVQQTEQVEKNDSVVVNDSEPSPVSNLTIGLICVNPPEKEPLYQ